MANMSPNKIPMPTRTPEERRRDFLEVATGYTAEQAIEEAGRCLQCKHKPCTGGCPVQVDIPAFIAALAAFTPEVFLLDDLMFLLPVFLPSAFPVFNNLTKSTAKNDDTIAINTALNNTEPKFFFGLLTLLSSGAFLVTTRSPSALALAKTFLSYALNPNRQNSGPVKIPNVITQAIVTNTSLVITLVPYASNAALTAAPS